jgi:hypothetical protein
MRFGNNFNSHRVSTGGGGSSQNEFSRKRDGKFEDKRHFGSNNNNFNRTLNVNGGG